MTSYYEILGISRSAGEKDIRRAFRRSARKFHPDLNPGDKDAEEKFKRINEAYEVLSDPDSRKKYDQHGGNWKHADQIEAQRRRGPGATFDWSTGDFDLSGGGLDDLLSRFGGSSRRRRDTVRRIEAPVEVTLEEAYAGTKRNVTIPSEDGERRIEVTIPPGVDTGSVVQISLDDRNRLLMNVTVLPHSRFERKGDDLYVDVQVPFEDAILGGEKVIQTLKRRVSMKVPPESQNGQRIRLAGQGMPKLGAADVTGDLYVTLRPTLPKNLTEEERELVKKLGELRSERR